MATEAATTTETETATTTTADTMPPSRHNHYRRPSLQELMSADETSMTRVPGTRLRPRELSPSSSATNNGVQQQQQQEGQTATTTRQRPKSEFEIYRDGGTARASPGMQLHRERRMREKELRALEGEYLNGRRRRGKKANITQEDEEEEEEEEEEDIEEEAPPRHQNNNNNNNNHQRPSAKSILSHRNPDLQLTPMPPPPLSLLHKRFATGTTPSKTRTTTATTAPPKRPSKLSPAPVLTPAPADPDVSPLEHMRHLRAQFEALRPPSSPHSSDRTPPPAPAPAQKPNPRRSTSSTSKPTTTAELIAHYTFTLSHLPALTHHSRTATLTLTPTTPSSPGHLTLNLRPATLRGSSHHTYTIPPHGLPITITSQHSPRSAPTTSIYELADLPLKHLPALRYAKAFVGLVQRATVVGRVEVREKHDGGKVWLGRRWADGRFEAADDAGNVVVRIDGNRGEHVSVWVAGKPVRDVGAARWEKAIDRAQRMWSACWRVLEEEEQEQASILIMPSTSTSPSTSKSTTTTPPTQKQKQKNPPHAKTKEQEQEKEQEKEKTSPIPFQIDSSTTFVPTIGWCRRDARTGLWCMLFLDGVRLEIDPATGDAVWADRGGGGGGEERRVLKGGMRMGVVRERVARFVERGL